MVDWTEEREEHFSHRSHWVGVRGKYLYTFILTFEHYSRINIQKSAHLSLFLLICVILHCVC